VFQREIKQGGREGKVYSYLGYVKLIKKYSWKESSDPLNINVQCALWIHLRW
jgi:hypothetical protein